MNAHGVLHIPILFDGVVEYDKSWDIKEGAAKKDKVISVPITNTLNKSVFEIFSVFFLNLANCWFWKKILDNL